METTREIALRTYKDATTHGMMDTPMNWHIWKMAFDTSERELKNLRVADIMTSLPDCKRWQMIADAIKKSKEKRIEQGFQLGVIKGSLYNMAFEDAIEWVLGNQA